MTGFVRRRGQTWTYYFKDNDPATGKQIQRTKGGFLSKRDAQAALAKAVHSSNQQTFVVPNRIDLRTFIEQHWLPAIQSTIRPSTWDSYRRNLDLHVLPHIGGLTLQAITPIRLNTLYRELVESGHGNVPGRGLSPKSVRNVHIALHKAFEDAVRWGLVQHNPAKSANPPKVRSSGNPNIRTWTEQQVGSFLTAVADDRLYALWRLAATTGMRRAELLGLRWEDINLSLARLEVRQTLVSVAYEVQFSTPKTTRSRRSIALDTRTVELLQRHREAQDVERRAAGDLYVDANLVFVHEDGRPIHPDSLSQTFERRVRNAGLPRIRLHDLRHTHATLALASGAHPKVVSERLGHSSVAFTLDIYSQAIPSMQDAAAEAFAKSIDKPPPEPPSPI